MPTESIFAPTWRLFEVARAGTTLLGCLCLLAGISGGVLSIRPRYRVRARRLAIGGAVALVCVLSLELLYRALSWAIGGGTHGLSPARAFLPETTLAAAIYGSGSADAVIGLSSVGSVARLTAVSGLSSVCLGCSIWSIASPNGMLGQTGVRGVALGIALLSLSVGARFFAAVNYTVGWSP